MPRQFDFKNATNEQIDAYIQKLVDAGVDLHGVDEAEGKKLNIVVVRII